MKMCRLCECPLTAGLARCPFCQLVRETRRQWHRSTLPRNELKTNLALLLLFFVLTLPIFNLVLEGARQQGLVERNCLAFSRSFVCHHGTRPLLDTR